MLKPLDDTRMYGKFGRTLAQRPSWQIHVAGRAAPAPTEAPANLHTHELLAGSRLSLARLRAQLRYWQLLQELKPNLIIVHAPELLPLTLLWQCLHPQKRQFMYDVRENYALNITTQQVYGGLTRRWLAAGLRWVETVAARRAAGIILAERSYAVELPFLAELPISRVVVLENKYQPAPGETLPSTLRPLPRPTEPLRLLYSGTISELNGVFDAIEFTKKLRQRWPLAHLTIIGFCQRPEQLARLHEAIAAANGAVSLIGGNTLVPHGRIVAEMERSHLGLLPYQPHESTWRCIPTKLYEYMAHGLPMLIPANALWQQLMKQHGAGLVVNFKAPDLEPITQHLTGTNFYPRGRPAEAFWQSEATKLWALLDTIQ
ncbi:Glycosyltransferase involved in cell wall bisynthesis [Hymenobacter daecheongensis DSM 21074]|uniref:Glycosyltransferase involved in cell wall bisynthesis n=1 Tax=Hymenobacter daecheongensis DSM 21074 TaxID=1121955 RepID=A0A1M6JVA6_9BACT|nr:glycosyltransferase [Hymenobacter daecheongensis]SHJ50634.1 Glycosyltransferase involved in cell wall bisynthesis [Hymenobacter daecheongensis DSM 21074]